MVMAIIYVRCGNYDKALDALSELLSSQTSYTVHDFAMNAQLTPLRQLPRYKEMIQKMTSQP